MDINPSVRIKEKHVFVCSYKLYSWEGENKFNMSEDFNKKKYHYREVGTQIRTHGTYN